MVPHWVIFLLIAVIIGILFFPEQAIHHPPGILVNSQPIQSPVSLPGWDYKGYHIQPLASYSITARVLSKYHYGFDDISDLVPYDLTLGWGKLSDESFLQHFKIGSGYRSGTFRQKDNFSITPSEIIPYFSNNHIIPANSKVEEKIGTLIKGNIVNLKGYLVEVTNSRIGAWRSSLTRYDETGLNACEIMWVEEVEVIK